MNTVIGSTGKINYAASEADHVLRWCDVIGCDVIWCADPIRCSIGSRRRRGKLAVQLEYGVGMGAGKE